MEVSLLKELDDNIKEPVPISKFRNLPVISMSDQLVFSEQGIGKCNHFTIRGYVSDVRKRDGKNCWPFSKLNRTSKGSVYKSPPLLVKKFRRWGCQICVRESVPSDVFLPNESRTTNPNSSGLKNESTLSRGDSLEKSLCEATESISIISEQFKQIKGGITESKGDDNRSNEDWNLINELTSGQIEQNGDGTMKFKTTLVTAVPSETICNIMSRRSEDASIIPDRLIAPSNLTVAEKKLSQGLCELGKRKESGSYVGRGVALSSIMAHNSHNDSVKKPHHKKSRKVRFLDEIIISEDLHKKDKVCASSDDSGSNGSIKVPDASEHRDDHPSCLKAKNNEHLSSSEMNTDEDPNTPHTIAQDSKALVVKNRKEAIQANIEGGCVIHWARKAPKSANLHKEGVGAKKISKFMAVKELDLNHDCRGRRENEHELMNSFNFLQASSVTMKDHVVIADQMKISQSRSYESMISKKVTHRKTGNEDDVRQRDLSCIKKNKRPLVEDKLPSEIQWLKDSLGIQEQGSIQEHRKVNKKQRTMRVPEQVAAENIPIDIVELLANKQPERNHMNTEDGSLTMCRLPKILVRTEESQCKNAGFAAWITVPNNENTDCSSKALDFGSTDEQYHDIDLNQEAPICASRGIHKPSRYAGLSITRAQPSNFDSNKSFSPQNIATGTKMIAFCPDQMDYTVSRTIFSSIHDSSSGILIGYPSKINAQNVDSDFGSNSICFEARARSLPHNAAVDVQSNNTISATDLLRFVHQSANSNEPGNSSMHNDPMGCLRVSNGNNLEYSWSPSTPQSYNHEPNQKAGNFHQPLRPLPRVGILGSQLQKEIYNTSNYSKLPLGFETRDLSIMPLQKTSSVARNYNDQAYSRTFERDKGEVYPLASRDGAFQPIRSPEKLGECVVNRNPADFAIIDKDCEYLIGYKEIETREMPEFLSLHSQTNLSSEKRKKVRKLNELKWARTSKKSSLSRLSYPKDAK